MLINWNFFRNDITELKLCSDLWCNDHQAKDLFYNNQDIGFLIILQNILQIPVFILGIIKNITNSKIYGNNMK